MSNRAEIDAGGATGLDEMTPGSWPTGITADKLKELGYSDEAIEAIQRKNPCAIGATLLAKPPGLAKMLLANPCRQDRLDELAQDPAHNGKETPGSRREAEVGLSLEEAGELPGPIQRDPSGAAEFIDATGQKWDVKAFNSNFPPRKGGFKLETAMDKIRGELDAGENVILDTKNLSPAHQQQLREAIEAQGWGDRIKWANP